MQVQSEETTGSQDALLVCLQAFTWLGSFLRITCVINDLRFRRVPEYVVSSDMHNDVGIFFGVIYINGKAILKAFPLLFTLKFYFFSC